MSPPFVLTKAMLSIISLILIQHLQTQCAHVFTDKTGVSVNIFKSTDLFCIWTSEFAIDNVVFLKLGSFLDEVCVSNVYFIFFYIFINRICSLLKSLV